MIYLTFLTALALSGVSAYYSVIGLAAIFPGSFWPIIIMGSVLEMAKLVTVSWLYRNWKTCPLLMKSYYVVACIILMMITSMGIFGYLSKAHLEHSADTAPLSDKVAMLDEKIKTEKENIDGNRKVLKQLDEGVDQVMARSSNESGAEKAVAIRKAQQKDRSRINQEIAESQKRIVQLNEERAPAAAEVRKVDAEVGPIKYIAAFVYGSTDPDILERAVTWVILLIIIVFDPLALILLISSQVSFQKFREREAELNPIHSTSEHYDLGKSSIEDHFDEVAESLTAAYPQDDGPISKEYLEHLQESAPKPNGAVTTSSTLFPEYSFGEEIHEENDHPFDVQLVPEEPIVVKGPTPVPKNEGARSRIKIFPSKSVIVPLPEEYVQNEEQASSNLWTTTTNTPITPNEYLQSIRDKKE